MLKNRKLLIDQDCHMCNIYGKCFSKIGLIDKNTISPYQTIHDSYANQIDMERAKNEIALLNTETSTTHYGIDAMIEIVVHRAVFLKKIITQQINLRFSVATLSIYFLQSKSDLSNFEKWKNERLYS